MRRQWSLPSRVGVAFPLFFVLLAIVAIVVVGQALLLNILYSEHSNPAIALDSFVHSLSLAAARPGETRYPTEIEYEDLSVESIKDIIHTAINMSSTVSGGKIGATVTRRGNQHHDNQDRSFIIQPFLSAQTPPGSNEPTFLLAILDGHGVQGHIVSRYVQKELPKRLRENLSKRECCQDDDWIRQQLNQTFLDVDKDGPRNLLLGGTTASVVLRIGKKTFLC